MLTYFPSSALPPIRNTLYISHSNHQNLVSELRLTRWSAAADDEFYPSHNRTLHPAKDAEEGKKNASNSESSSRATNKSFPSRDFSRGNIKYPKQPERYEHPAFRKVSRITRLPTKPKEDTPNKSTVRVAEDGVSYVIDGAPFEFKYSYTETPKAKAMKLREPPFSPFGPEETPRPWTGKAPLPSSKKQLKEFDSFHLPPPNKKGVKPVQAPGPYLAGTAPRYVYTREEILGEPLTPEEIQDLVNGCLKSKRQLNMGRDGFTHNMLDNIHAHWKRKRVCKIKCKGVCTVDMDNVCQQLEEKTGGKIIHRNGGLLYLFRGRNYNFKTRPRFPLMLWKPITPIYPKLVKKKPEGLTLEEATALRAKGNKLTPICKLGKNGVYTSLVKLCQEAFEVCELVKIDCAGLNPSDYRKIGAKLKDLVPCVIISFEREQILLWRRNEKSPMGSVRSVGDSEQQSEKDTKGNNVEAHVDGSQMKSGDLVGSSESMHVKGIKMLDVSSEEKSKLFLEEEKEQVCMQQVMQLWKQAIESKSAVLLTDENLDADRVYESSVALAKTSPPSLIFRHEGKRVDAVKSEGKISKKDSPNASENGDKKKAVEIREFDQLIEVPLPQRSLVIDELAKLLAS